MFDIGFWEILIIGLIALVVIGPERLPGVARNVGFWVGKTRRFIQSVQSEFNDELQKADEIQHMVKKEFEIKELHEKIDMDDSRQTVTAPRAKPTTTKLTQTTDASSSTSAAEDGKEKDQDKEHVSRG